MPWKDIISEEQGKPYFQVLRSFVEDERQSHTVYPSPVDTFNALKATPYDMANVVILGQDPYHGPGQAHGLSFSVRPGVAIPPSLRNIYRELSEDVGFKPPTHGHLLSWAQQGVLLLNSTLTVRAGEPGSHKGMGWERFTDRLLGALNDREQPVVFVLWGKTAREKTNLLDNPKHTIIQSAHPSPMSASSGFFGSRPFSAINRALEVSGQKPICWDLH